MLRINVLTHLVEELFIKQLPLFYKEEGVIFEINSSENIVWDYVVVYEDIDIEYTFLCKKGGLIFFSGEPPFVKVYSREFLNQFDHIVSSHPNDGFSSYYKMQQSLPWYFGYDFKQKKINYFYEQLEQVRNYPKTKKISFISSSREYLPGHASRLNLLKKLQIRYADEIDFFGKGINEIDDKAEGLLSYRFSICVENSNIEDYWSEKIADAFLGYTVPLYFGCKNINEYFPEDSYIPLDITNMQSVYKIIDHILEDPEDIYQKHLSGVTNARNKLLYEYNLFPSIITLTKRIQLLGEVKTITIKSSTVFNDSNFKNRMLKIKRIVKRYKDKFLI